MINMAARSTWSEKQGTRWVSLTGNRFCPLISLSDLNCVVAYSNLFINNVQSSRYPNTSPYLFLSLKFIRVKSGPNSLIELNMEVHKTKVKTEMKIWNQRMKDENVVLHEIYTDFRDSDKKVPCSLIFKTDRIQEVIELHKVNLSRIQTCTWMMMVKTEILPLYGIQTRH